MTITLGCINASLCLLLHLIVWAADEDFQLS